MRVAVVEADDLSESHLKRWHAIQAADPLYASPLLAPEFVQAVHASGRRTRVAILEDRSTILGFFAFESGRFGIGHPAGAPLSEYHGPVVAAGAEVDMVEILRASGLSCWTFDHLVDRDTIVAAARIQATEKSLVVDMSEGAVEFEAELRRRGSRAFVDTRRKMRKASREVGDLRLELRVAERAPLRKLLEWKSAQCARTGRFDVFRFEWPHRLVERIHETRTPDFEGMLTVLHAGEEILALQLGMRWRHVWHWWLPSYAPEFAPYSPGAALLVSMIDVAGELGIRRIDLGKGDEHYKTRFGNIEVPVHTGRFERPGLVTTAMRARRGVMRALRASPFSGSIEKIAGWVRNRAREGRNR